MYINNDGGGFADWIEIAKGVTVSQFFATKVNGNPDDYLVRVNRENVEQNYVLQDNDRVSITPTKIDGGM